MKYVVAAIVALAASLSISHAAVLDFVADASGKSFGVANGFTKTYGNVGVTFTATGGSNPYFDDLLNGKPGGLGACALKKGPGSKCAVANDDNINFLGESVTLAFDQTVDLSNFSFTGQFHPSLNASTKTLLVNGVEWTFANLVQASLTGLNSITFAFGGSKPTQFYVNNFTAAPIPIPAAAPLLLSALIGFGMAARRRKRSA